MPRIERTAEAARDLRDIWRYIALHGNGRDVATRVLRRLNAAIALAAEYPKIGVDQSEIDVDLRSRMVRPYYIFYYPLPDGIRVARVLHAARDVRREIRGEAGGDV